jgi:2,3-dihydroxybenzoate decarboxylase
VASVVTEGSATIVKAKIALEEHFMAPALQSYWEPTVKDMPRERYDQVLARLSDFGEMRLAAMDRAGIGRVVLSLSGPGVQAERDAAVAVRKAREANDFLAKEIEKRPTRYSGFAHLALQDPVEAADELERCMRDLKFCGAMINGHTNGQYLDHPSLNPFWERAEALDAPIYLHPADPLMPHAGYSGYKALTRATWGWTVETATHALRLVFGGVFDRFPKATLVLGHMGETQPFQLWRFDSRAAIYGAKLARKPSEYIRQNMFVTISGVFSAAPLHCAIAALGHDRVLFSADYPFESPADAGDFMDTVALDEEVRKDIAFRNAERLLRLSDSQSNA